MISNKEVAERCRKAAWLMRNLKGELPMLAFFDMPEWYREIGGTAWREENVINPPPAGCSTSACALGAMAMHPYFQALGLRLEKIGTAGMPYVDTGPGERLSGSSAGAFVLGIGYAEASAIFNGHGFDALMSQITPEMVAEKFDELAEEYERREG